MFLSKLITSEDPFHIHKSMGIYCLINFIIQGLNYLFYGKIFISKYVMIPHVLLHVTSFVFSVLKKRPISNDGKLVKKMAMFIWEELRLHSMFFGFRSILSIIYPDYAMAIIFFTMAGADISTIKYGTANVSTVRGNQNIEKKSIVKTLYSAFFSISQIGATIICGSVFQRETNKTLVFFTLPAIQTSAFGMTLLRKNIITKEIWQLIYSFELLIVYFVWYSEYKDYQIIPASIAIYLLRKMNINKYFIWFMACMVTYDHRINAPYSLSAFKE
jgi:hypothetical protein